MRVLYLVFSIAFFGFSQAQQASIALSEMNIIYSGINNPIRITIAGVDSQNILVQSSSNIELTKYKHPNWGVFTNSKGTAYVQIGKLVDTDTIWLGKQLFRIRLTPKPYAQLGGIQNDGVPKGKASILAQSILIANMEPAFPYNLQYHITKFRIKVNYKDRPDFTETIIGETLSTEAKKAIGVAYAGDHITFNEIEAEENRYGLQFILSPILISLRESKNQSEDIFTNLEYLSYGDSKPVITNRKTIDSIKETTINGTYTIVYTSKWGFHNYSIAVVNSIVNKKSLTDHLGKPIFDLSNLQHDTWKLAFYDQKTRKPKITCNHNEAINFVGNININDWTQTKNGYSTKSTILDTFFTALALVNTRYQLNPIGQCSTYYQNGNLKTTGNLEFYDNRVYEGKTYNNIILPLGFTGSFHNHGVSLMHGTWLFYKPDGTLLETREYDMGVLVR